MSILLNQWNANNLFPTAEESLNTSKKALQGQIHPKTAEELILVLKAIEEASSKADVECQFLGELREETIHFLIKKHYMVSKITRDTLSNGNMILGYKISWANNL